MPRTIYHAYACQFTGDLFEKLDDATEHEVDAACDIIDRACSKGTLLGFLAEQDTKSQLWSAIAYLAANKWTIALAASDEPAAVAAE